jgi:hypothetical protein
LLRLGSPIQPLVLARPDTIVDLADQLSIAGLYGPPLHNWSSYDLEPGRMALCLVALSLRLSLDPPMKVGSVVSRR